MISNKIFARAVLQPLVEQTHTINAVAPCANNFLLEIALKID